jgi:hypothetical protein
MKTALIFVARLLGELFTIALCIVFVHYAMRVTINWIDRGLLGLQVRYAAELNRAGKIIPIGETA